MADDTAITMEILMPRFLVNWQCAAAACTLDNGLSVRLQSALAHPCRYSELWHTFALSIVVTMPALMIHFGG